MTNEDTEYAIDLQRVSKTYRGGVQALREASLQVNRGEIFGLLGPNGAGKSTLVKILMTIIRGSQVEGTMLGRPIGHTPTLSRVGYLPEHVQFPPYLTGHQVLGLAAGLHKLAPATWKPRAAELLQMVGMADRAGDKLGTYSKGMRQRVGIAQALINDPEIVFLDEPTDGVDPVGRKEIRDLLVRMRAEGRTVFVNSHLLGELEMISDRVAILSAGELVQQGKLDDLLAREGSYEVQLDPATPLPSGHGISEVLPAEGGTALQVSAADPAALQPVLDALRSAGCHIIGLQEITQSLEELFMESVAPAVAPPPIPAG